MNAPDRGDFNVLSDGELPISVEEDTKIPNAATFTINKEDHTLANLLRSQLLLNPRVLFAGYQLAHPLEPRFTLKVQTDSADYTPIKAIEEAVRFALGTLAKLKDQVINESVRARALADESLGAAGQGVGGYGGMDEPLGFAEPTYAEY